MQLPQQLQYLNKLVEYGKSQGYNVRVMTHAYGTEIYGDLPDYPRLPITVFSDEFQAKHRPRCPLMVYSQVIFDVQCTPDSPFDDIEYRLKIEKQVLIQMNKTMFNKDSFKRPKKGSF